MAQDFFAKLDGFFDSVHASMTGKQHHSGDERLDQAWDELDAFMNSNIDSGAGFRSDLDEFDRRMAALGHKARPEQASRKENTGGRSSTEDFTGRYQQQKTSQGSSSRPLSAEEERMVKLAQDYRNLEAEIGAGSDEVKKAYKRVLMKYHPDRFAQDPEKQATATQITARLNESYGRIMDYLDRRGRAN